MDAIFTNSEKNKTFEPYGLLLNLANKITLKRSDIYVALSNRSMYFTWKNINKKNKKVIQRKAKKKKNTHTQIKMSAPTLTLELPNRSYSKSDTHA